MTDTAKYKGLLESEKTKLEAELATVGRRNPSNPNDWEAVPQETGQEPDVIDAGDHIEGYEDNAGILKELEARLQDVLTALKRIEEGTYGTCSVDGEAIPEERLEANPAALTCIAHA
jgi:RNA polymerase-binding transcription factor DksA